MPIAFLLRQPEQCRTSWQAASWLTAVGFVVVAFATCNASLRGQDAEGSRSPADAAPSPSDAEPAPPAVDDRPVNTPADSDSADSDSADSPADDATAARPSSEKGLKFSFRYAPWKDVLDWFSTQADLSLVMDAPPPGTFNYVDARSYSPSEAIDLLNSVLLTKGYTLVRRDRMLMLINLDDGIPPNLVTTVPVSELDDRGEFELVSTLFRLRNVQPDEAEQEIQKLLGPQGTVQVLGKARQIFVTETAGRLRTIRDVLQAMEDPEGTFDHEVKILRLTSVTPEEALPVIRQMLGIPEETFALPDGSLRLGTDVLGQNLLVTGQPGQIKKLEKILQLIDHPAPRLSGSPGILQTPQLEVYPVKPANPTTTLQVLQTLLADEPDVRLAVDEGTGHLVAMGLPGHHATIRATIEQLKREAESIVVIPLDYVDPQTALLAVTRLFGVGEEDNEQAPRVEADVTGSRLLVRGTPAQVAQIRSLIEQLDDGSQAAYVATSGGRVRTLPMSQTQAETVLEQIERIWPTVGTNRIRRVVPSATMRAIEPRESDGTSDGPRRERIPIPARAGGLLTPGQLLPAPGLLGPDDLRPAAPRSDGQGRDEASDRDRERGRERDQERGRDGDEQRQRRREDRRERRPDRSGAQRHRATRYATLPTQQPAASPADGGDSIVPPSAPATTQPESAPSASAASSSPSGHATDAQDRGEPGADIIVAPGPNGLVIASNDLEALDQFQRLVETLIGSQTAQSDEYAVFYLRHATAESAAALLNQILEGGTGGSSVGDMAGNLLGAVTGGVGGIAGDLMGSLLGGDGGSGFTASGPMSIVPDPRLNVLIVKANPTDLKMVEHLLEIIDQRRSPETVQTMPAPRMIPVRNTSAEQVAEVVRQVYATRMASQGGGQRGQPSPQDILRALRGGRGGGGNDGEPDASQQMTVGVDTRSNALIVAAPDGLFEEVRMLVAELDRPELQSGETTRVVTLRKADPELVRRALATLVGQSTTPTRSGQAGGQPAQQPSAARPQPGAGGGQPEGPQPNPEEMRRRIEFFRAMQQRAAGGGRPGGGRPGGDAGRGRGGGRTRGGR